MYNALKLSSFACVPMFIFADMVYMAVPDASLRDETPKNKKKFCICLSFF